MRLAGLAALTALTTLVACVHVPVQVADGLTFPQRQARLAGLEQWSMRGRIAVVAGDEGFSGRFSWIQRDDALELRIRGPLGAGAMAIAGDAERLLVTARGATEPVTINDPERELPGILGWWVPVRSVPAWLLGIPDGGYAASPSFDAEGLLASFEQRGWQVQVMRYQLVDQTLIPAQLQLDHRDLSMKVIVDGWTASRAD